MVKQIDVTNGSRVYVGSVEQLFKELLPEKRIIVISDSNIDRTHHDLIAPYEHILIGQGEQAKSLATTDEIYRKLIDMGADRSTFILGIGGGIVTDVAGFVASTYMRGVEFGFVTTTLLGSVDASVGGKNGVNVGGFKNMVGTFSQPRFVICDVALLHTLSDREFRAGLAEVIKTAILGDRELFELLENSSFEELRKLRKHFPQLWKKLGEWDEKTWRTYLKNYSVKQLDTRFAFEEECLAKGLPIKGKAFFNALREKLKED